MPSDLFHFTHQKIPYKVVLYLFSFAGTLLAVYCTDKAENSTPLTVDFRWNPPCTPLGRSPEIKIDVIPEGTVRWYVQLTDLHLPAFDHGSGFAPVGQKPVIPPGAVEGSYQGPSPPYGVIHDYEITVMARDAENRTLGIGKKTLVYPPPGEEEFRWLPCTKRKP